MIAKGYCKSSYFILIYFTGTNIFLSLPVLKSGGMEFSEQLVVEQLKQGNEEAYRYLYRNHYSMLCHVAREFVGDGFLAETLVGDVIFHIWEVREFLDIQISLRSYLVQAVRNRCKDYLSSKKERSEVTFSALADNEDIRERYIISEGTPLGSLLERELEYEIYRAIDELPEECRQVFRKSRFEGKKYEEISQETGISINTVKYHIKNALATLYGKLGKYLLTIFFFFFG